MHYDFIRGREGDVWNVFLDLAVETSQTLVTPRSAVRGVQPSHQGQRLHQNGRLIVLGYDYYLSAAATRGFELAFRQHVGSPASGDSVDRVFLRVVSDGTNSIANTALTFIEADCGGYSPLANASELKFTRIVGAAVAGYLHIWGIHTDGEGDARSKLHTYSPGQNYNTASS